MPKPHTGEKQSDFVSRAIREFMMEGYSQRVAKGRAYGFWRSAKKKKKA